MFHTHNEKWEKRINSRYWTATSRKNQDVRRKDNIQRFGNIGSEHHQKGEDEQKIKKKRISQTNEKTSRNKPLQQKSHQMDEYLDIPLVRYSGPFLK